MTKGESSLRMTLAELAGGEEARSIILAAIAQAEEELRRKPDQPGAAVQIPLSVFGEGLPDLIKSCRVFALRANTEFKTERHPNSQQRVLSVKGAGEIRVFDEQNPWTARLRSAPDAPPEERWATMGENVWHRPVAGAANWVTLTFHTASERELVDEFRD